ncbi:FkbM family methyltransferase [Scytonema hofmannii]|uniref:FkbM family methyltransferase n=1 Tax=Scytonema hofmannii TaxID=34078 RepID=UPI000347CCE9|nr:FkbM family methyltransferase [Scytonema hofmannii]
MSLFLPYLKRTGYLDNIHITVCIIGSRKLVSQDDYGSQSWQIFAPNLTIYGFDADTDICSDANNDLTARNINWTEKHIPLALWNCTGKAKLFVTQFPGCSSLYPPSNSYIKRFAGNSELIKLVSTSEIETTTLDNFCHSENIGEIDFIQLDVQGAELGVLEGATKILETSTLGIITEVEFTEIYTGQPLYSDVDIYLRKQGFSLFDLSHTHRDIRKNIPLVSQTHQGALIWSDAFYFRDLIGENLTTNLKTPEKILKLACLADVLSFPDYALELLVHLTLHYGKDEKYNFADCIIESLAYVTGLTKQSEKLASLPIIKKKYAYSSSYNSKFIAPNSESFSNYQFLQKGAYQFLLLGEYKQAANLYEQAIELEPNIKSNYWYLGLLLFLQGQEEEAQVTWFVGFSQAKTGDSDDCIAELVEVLKTEVKRRIALKDRSVALALEEQIKALAPESSLINSSIIKYSHLDEESIIKKYLNTINFVREYCVDIAASDGLTMSNTYFLFEKGWSGLAVECDREKFAALASNYIDFSNVNLSKLLVTPDNIVSLLEANQIPKDFGLLNLDVDGYDYFILDKLLTAFRPTIICAEINEKIPPPLKFTVNWDSSYVWENNHFYGQSICQLNILCDRYEYALVELHYNNAFLIPKEISPYPSISPEEAYKKGYLERSDRKQKFPWNADIEELYSLSPERALNYVNRLFSKYHKKFSCEL